MGVKLQQRVTRTRVNGCKLLEFRWFRWSLWIRRVLVRAQEGQLGSRGAGAASFRGLVLAHLRWVSDRAQEGQLEALCCGLCLRRHVLDSVRTAPYLRPCTSRPEHTRRKPGSQNHWSSPPPGTAR